MVCHRCKMVVQATLEKQDLHPVSMSLGEVVLAEDDIPKEKRQQLEAELKAVGFELIDDQKSRLIEQIKTYLIGIIHHNEDTPNKNYSELLSQHLHHDYSYLSNLFSTVEGITIEQFIINHKIEKVKELLLYGELSLSEIAFQLKYSSTAHLSSQFKKLTGFTPTEFKKMGQSNRRPLDQIGIKK